MRTEKRDKVDTKISDEQFEAYIDKIFTYMKEKLLEKNRVYGSASFEGGKMAVIGNAFRQRDKSNRQMHLIKTLIESGASEEPFGESLWDTICDQFGYATIGLTLLAILRQTGEEIFDLDISSVPAQEPKIRRVEPVDAFGYDPYLEGDLG